MTTTEFGDFPDNCPKCGLFCTQADDEADEVPAVWVGPRFKLRHVSDGWGGWAGVPFTGGECLEWTCRRCGFPVQRLCKDAA